MNAKKPLAAALLALVLLGLSPLTPKATAATVNPCGTAQQMLEKGRFQQAETLYTQLSSVKLPAATQACARQGLTAVDALSAAQQLFAAGLPQQADEEIVRALNAVTLLILPTSVPPATGQNGVELAEALDANGFRQQAQQILEQVVEADPQLKLDRTERGILGQVAPGFYAQAGHSFSRVSNFITSPIPASACVALALIIGLNVYYRMRRRLHLQPFAFGGAPGARRRAGHTQGTSLGPA
jgi:tetratricopeptide (TPR) repeat protein